MKAWLVVNGGLHLPKFNELYQFIQNAATKQNVDMRMVSNDQLVPIISAGKNSLASNLPLPDFVVFMDKDIYLAKHLEQMGLPVLNSAIAIDICDNKIKTHLALVHETIPMPKTIIAPFLYDHMFTSELFLEKASEQLGFPLVLKEAHGSFGEQVYLIETIAQLSEKVKSLGSRPFLLQKFIETSKGKDIRLNVVGNQVICAMLRQSESDFRANASQGGMLTSYQPSEAESKLAIQATQAVGADFAGVDLLLGKSGPLVCEINSNAHLLNIYRTTGVNVADAIIDYCLKQNFLEK